MQLLNNIALWFEFGTAGNLIKVARIVQLTQHAVGLRPRKQGSVTW